jgi:ribosomal protein L37E
MRMGVRDHLPISTDGGTDDDTHHECRDCGRNLEADTESCPACGGGVAVYRL